MRLAKNFMAGVAALGMVAMPVAAQANTRAGDVDVSVAPVAQSVTTGAARTGASVSAENELAGAGLIIAIVALVAVVAGVIIAADDDESDGA